ncbi:MAG: CDP-diacylglycerol/serineO-phosphatidyltransferase [Gammaproteobacteria bacterium]|jgi:CDP-diacylglycerol--serine O-phosphatidyltransferase|nr:CDP-diacylglycerol/serineO-phosphatidyltransferase [Gammaproteobacteria bacterium]
MRPEPSHETEPPKPRRGIYLLPNLLTTASLFAGFYSIVNGMQGHFHRAAMAIFVAMVMDGLDGRVARLTNTQTAFGVEFDSLADLVSFGLAPALVAYSWCLHDLGNFGWLASFWYVAATALRLARFNTQVINMDKRYFQGIPSPAAAAVVAGAIGLSSEYQRFPAMLLAIILGIFLLALGILMVSNIRYYSFKESPFKERVPFVTIIATVLIFAGIAIAPMLVLFLAFLVYAISGPVLTLKTLRVRRSQRHRGE